MTAYPETQALIKVYGVGHLTALTFVLTLGKKERDVAAATLGSPNRCLIMVGTPDLSRAPSLARYLELPGKTLQALRRSPQRWASSTSAVGID